MRKVVVGTDGSPQAIAAVRWSADEAARRGCPLHIVHVTGAWAYDVPLHAAPGFRESLEGYGEGLLAASVAAAREQAPEITVTTELATGTILRTLARESAEAVEIVLGGRGAGGFAGLLLGSVSLAVAGHARGPVVVVRRFPLPSYGEVVVGFDGSEHSQAALEYAFEEAAVRHARLRAIHAWQAPMASPFLGGNAGIFNGLIQAEKENAAKALAPWRSKYPEVDVEATVVCEHPVSAIRDAAEHADLVVVGSRGHGGLMSALLGSVGHGVLHHVRCPVAVVRPRPA